MDGWMYVAYVVVLLLLLSCFDKAACSFLSSNWTEVLTNMRISGDILPVSNHK